MPKSPVYRVPAGFGKAGKALWKAVCEGLVMRPDELATLESACRTADLAASLEELVANEPMMIAGSHKQAVLHPAISELRMQRQLLASLLARLDVPEVASDGAAGEWDSLTSSQRARKAARARWDSRTGTGG